MLEGWCLRVTDEHAGLFWPEKSMKSGLSSGKVQPSSLRQAEQQKSISDQILSGHLEGPPGNCGNTTVVQSMAVLLTGRLHSSKWPVKATQGEAVLGILWKFPSLAAVGKSPIGWVTGLVVKLQGEQLPLGSFVFSLIWIWICCTKKSGDASKAQPPSPGLAPGTGGGRGSRHGVGVMWPATWWGGEATWLLSQALHSQQGPSDRNSGWPPPFS